MARSKRRNGTSIEPAQRVLSYVLTPSSGGVTVDIDLAKDLSAVNRRLYRQGMQYYVSGITVFTPGTTRIQCMAQTAGDTWIVHNAWKKGRALWLEQQRDAAKAIGISMGTWADFKVTLDDNDSAAINTLAGDSGAITPDEWNYSELVYEDDGDEYSPTMHLLGTSTLASGVGLVQEYAISRNQLTNPSPVTPAEASDSIYAKMLMATDEFSDILIDDIEGHNDSPPYDHSEYVGGDTVADAPFTQSVGIASGTNSVAHLPGFTAECGLIRLICASTAVYDAIDTSTNPDTITQHTNTRDEAFLVMVQVAPGPYKGVMASKMGQ